MRSSPVAPVITGNITTRKRSTESRQQQGPAQAEAADRPEEPRAVLLHGADRLDGVVADERAVGPAWKTKLESLWLAVSSCAEEKADHDQPVMSDAVARSIGHE